MAFDVACLSTTARVRSARVRRDLARVVPENDAYLVVAPRCPTRLWSLVVDESIAGFQQGLASGGAPDVLLTQAVSRAGERLRALRDQLIEPSIPLDAQLGAVVATPTGFHVALTTGIRVYRARGRVPERLFARTPRPTGLAEGTAFFAYEPWQRGEIFLIGTHDAFTLRTIANVASVLLREGATANEVAEALLAPLRDDGVGACVIALRPG